MCEGYQSVAVALNDSERTGMVDVYRAERNSDRVTMLTKVL